MGKKAFLTEQTFYLIVGRCLAFSFTLAHPVIFVRVFPQDEYGLYRQLILIFTTLLPLGQMGVTSGIFYFLPREPEKKNALILQTLLLVVTLGALLFGGLILFKQPIANAFHNEEMAKYISLLGAYCFFMISSSFFETCMITESRAKLASFVVVLSQIVNSTVIILAALLTHSINFVMYALIVFSGCRFVFQNIYLFNKYVLSIKNIDFRFWKRQLAYTIPMGLSNIAWLLQGKLHSYFISFLFTPATFAIYAIGSYNLPIVYIINASVTKVLTPALSSLQKKGQKAELIKTWNNAIAKPNLFLLPIFIFFMFMADEFIIGLFTENYSKSIPIFRISLLIISISAIRPFVILAAYAKTKYIMNVAFLRLPLTITVLYIFTKTWGVLGAISTNFIMEIVFKSVYLIKVAKVLEVPLWSIIEWRRNGKIFFVAAASGVSLLPLKFFLTIQPLIALVIGFILYSICYGLLSFLFGTVGKQEWRMFLNYAMEKLRISKSD